MLMALAQPRVRGLVQQHHLPYRAHHLLPGLLADLPSNPQGTDLRPSWCHCPRAQALQESSDSSSSSDSSDDSDTSSTSSGQMPDLVDPDENLPDLVEDSSPEDDQEGREAIQRLIMRFTRRIMSPSRHLEEEQLFGDFLAMAESPASTVVASEQRS